MGNVLKTAKMLDNLINRIFSANKDNFEALAIDIFNYQYTHNKVYHDYVNSLRTDIGSVSSLKDIPFLPIDLFKTHKVITGVNKFEKVFESSGTTGIDTSSHYLQSVDLYIESFTKCFNSFYGNISDYCIIGLLPSYLEKGNSSLVFMLDHLIRESGKKESGFYLHNYNDLIKTLDLLEKKKQKTIVFGVSYALLDLAEIIDIDLNNTTIIETGGMKGRREELPKYELHNRLKKGFKLNEIHSEYGMTELLSQAYSKSKGIFNTPPWMRILIRDTYDPFTYNDYAISGGINIIDLANINSCSFIETKDLGKLYKDGSFEVLGRFDQSDIRGCNLLVE